jgi:hypothetical protein
MKKHVEYTRGQFSINGGQNIKLLIINTTEEETINEAILLAKITEKAMSVEHSLN